MSSITSGPIWIAAAAFGLAVGLAAPAWAGDDGAAPIWKGFGDVFGITQEDESSIDYREHGKLVLPPKNELPAPGTAALQPGNTWPVDPDVKRARKAKLEEAKPKLVRVGRPGAPLIAPGVPVTVTMGATAGQGPGPAPCVRVDPQTGECPKKPGPTWNYNPLTWVGIVKKPPVVLGPEPFRENLTDPPVGYRAPVEGVGATIADK